MTTCIRACGRAVLAVALALTLSRCGGSDSTPLNSFSQGLVNAAATLAENTPRPEYDVDASTGNRMREASVLADLSAVWTAGGYITNLYNNGVVSYPNMTPKAWMGAILDPDFRNANGAATSAFGRFSNTLEILCAIGSIIPNDGTLPTVGTHSASVTAGDSRLSDCGMDTSDISGTMSITATVTATTDTTYFDRKLVINGDIGGTQTVLVGIRSDGTLNLASQEDSDEANRGNRSLYFYNPTTHVTRFEYMSLGFASDQNSNGYELYRIFIDTTNDVGHVLGNYGGGDNTTTIFARFTVSGKPSTAAADTHLGVSMQYQQPGGGTELADRNACVQASDGSITDTDTLACDINGTGVSGATAIDGMWSAHQGASDPSTFAVTETSAPSFTNATDFYTASN